MRGIEARLDAITAEIAAALVMADGLEKYDLLARLHRQEAEVFQDLFTATSTRLTWLAAAAAVERSRERSRFWDAKATRETVRLADGRELVPTGAGEGVAA